MAKLLYGEQFDDSIIKKHWWEMTPWWVADKYVIEKIRVREYFSKLWYNMGDTVKVKTYDKKTLIERYGEGYKWVGVQINSVMGGFLWEELEFRIWDRYLINKDWSWELWMLDLPEMRRKNTDNVFYF